MGMTKFLCGASVAVLVLGAECARAQVVLPEIDVTASRLVSTAPASGGGTTAAPAANIGIVGASTSVVTREEIDRAPQSTLQDIISREAGITTQSFYGGVNGTGTVVDLRGFGVTAPSNVLVLVDGRRFNDSDQAGFDFSLIPRNSIDHIEITRGNSGAVLYGDGAVGGVINIVTKNGAGAPPNARVEGGFGSFATRDARVSALASYNGFAAAGFGNEFLSDGYRDHNKTQQTQGVGDLRYATPEGTVFFNISADDLRQQLPGPRNILNGPFVGFIDEYANDRRGTDTPNNYANRQNVAVRGGATRTLWSGVDFILDGSFRQKKTQSGFYNPYNTLFVIPDTPSSYVTASLATASITPRVNVDQTFGAFRARMIAGLDVYKTNYESDRALVSGAPPSHVYNIDQLTTAVYAQPTITIAQNTDVSAGGRLQRNSLHARDTYDPAAPAGFPVPQGIPLDDSEMQHAYHIGFEHRFAPGLAMFARTARSFRVPNVDDRIGSGPLFGTTNFALRTQTSRDYEGGARLHFGAFELQSSAYLMNLNDEIHFNPFTFSNVNLDPTRRYGVETAASYKLSNDITVKASGAYIRAVFRDGPFAGNDVPEVPRWAGSAGVAWNIYEKYLTLDAVVRFSGKRYMDGDENNAAAIMMVPESYVVDVRLGGKIEKFFWSVSVQNLFDRLYFDYGLNNSFPGNESISIYPLPGRTFLLKAGATF